LLVKLFYFSVLLLCFLATVTVNRDEYKDEYIFQKVEYIRTWSASWRCIPRSPHSTDW